MKALALTALVAALLISAYGPATPPPPPPITMTPTRTAKPPFVAATPAPRVQAQKHALYMPIIGR